MYANSCISFSKHQPQRWLLWPAGVEPSELNVSSLHIRFSSWYHSDVVASYFNNYLHEATGNRIKQCRMLSNLWRRSFISAPWEYKHKLELTNRGWFLRPPAIFSKLSLLRYVEGKTESYIIREKKLRRTRRTKVVADKQRGSMFVGNWPRLDRKLR